MHTAATTTTTTTTTTTWTLHGTHHAHMHINLVETCHIMSYQVKMQHINHVGLRCISLRVLAHL